MLGSGREPHMACTCMVSCFSQVLIDLEKDIARLRGPTAGTGRIFSRQQLAEIVLSSVQVGWGVLLAV